MDKMGESDRAKNRGTPATPRDGADIEIIGLLKSTLRWLSELVKSRHFATPAVLLQDGNSLTYGNWDALLQESFEKFFWIPEKEEEDSQYKIDRKLINRRGIYKDVLGCTLEWADYQLRPNMCIAMAVVPIYP